ncbi:hypothetical protein B0H17DRAFT_937852 [Mycena rosella]|uniref:Uncharacterized protein n=1 Tax=Mycena rosella TaxID=1033263 RepID=A0AAD7DE06_MYCRO|nr:hypothetical protein B0H17DRAFT_937852 [Mycena rosella]
MPAAKRKSDGAASGSRTKKAKNAPDHTEAQELVGSLIEGDGDVEISPSEARVVAEYTRWLEGELAATKPKEKSLEEIQAAAEKLRNACVSGIKKQMAWKPTCKTGGAKWSYDGVCADPIIFGSMLNLDAAPKWKMHKYTVPEFEAFMGSIEASVRYDTLELCGNVNVRYQPDEGTFKMSGSYGALRHMNK